MQQFASLFSCPFGALHNQQCSGPVFHPDFISTSEVIVGRVASCQEDTRSSQLVVQPCKSDPETTPQRGQTGEVRSRKPIETVSVMRFHCLFIQCKESIEGRLHIRASPLVQVTRNLRRATFRSERRSLCMLVGRRRILQHLPHRLACQPELPRHFPPATPLHRNCPPYPCIQFHCVHASGVLRKHTSSTAPNLVRYPWGASVLREIRMRRRSTFTPPRHAANAARYGLFLLRRS
jgi:hypothetical protein